MKTFKYTLILLMIMLPLCLIKGQDIEDLLEDELDNTTEYTVSTFHSTRIIFGQSIERMPKKGLDLRIEHRFGLIQDGWQEFFGIDQSSSFLGLEYGLNDRVMIGLGRATYKKTVSGFIKAGLLRQSSGSRNVPVSVGFVSSLAMNTTKYGDEEKNDNFSARLDYTNQLLIARKFNKNLSLQVTPTHVHRNMVRTNEEKNDLLAVGIGGRYKISNRVAITAEYYYVEGIQEATYAKYENPLAVGVDIQAGSHVFQIHLTNAMPMTENNFLGETTGNFFKGDIRIGFNISQVFSL